MTNFIFETLQDSLDKSSDFWVNSPFQDLQTLSADERGRWGEALMTRFINEHTNHEAAWDGDSNINPGDGTYDIKVDGKLRCEVKTATYGVNKCWQHHDILESPGWDVIFLIDVDYDAIWFTVLKHEEIDFHNKHEVFGTTPSLPTSKNDHYKWDFRHCNLQRGIRAGLTFGYHLDSPDNVDLAEFIGSRIS